LEETERRFDEFWNEHISKLKQNLELRRFEQEFRELQVRFFGVHSAVNFWPRVGNFAAL
jgi:hypothetical protein